MKVLQVHNRYRSSAPSGEDAVVLHERELLRAHGVEVVTYERRNDDIVGFTGLLRTAVDTVWSASARREVAQLIRRERPDVAHFHNVWYSISASALQACHDAGVPVALTLHNYRMFCANGVLLRGGRVCEACVGRLPWPGLLHGCFRSRLFTVPVVTAQLAHRLRATWTGRVGAFIALSEFARGKFIECGLPAERIFVKPNFLARPPPEPGPDAGYGLFLGRLSREKGVDVLLRALRAVPYRTKIVGDGPLRAELEARREEWGLRHVQFTGQLPWDDCQELLSRASFLVVPSICYENFPMVIAEAYACGRPVLASRLGALPELVHHGRTGLLFEAGDADALADALRRLAEDPEQRRSLGAQARRECEERFGPARNLELLMGVYRRAMSLGDGGS
ncbi:MAG TPA: glycosyltransferase [Anaeromyxobacter sp.]|nr:glycosyltransferase [Anaeromyxobacter sp.]